MKNLRFGLIGCGGMGSLHALNATYVPGMQIVGYADLVKEKAESLLAGCGGEYATNDPQKIIDDRSIDAVLLVTGEKHHPRLGIAAAKAGKHMLMEKPVAVTMEEAMELRAVLKRSPVKYQIGLCNRLAPMVQKAKQLLPNSCIAKLLPNTDRSKATSYALRSLPQGIPDVIENCGRPHSKKAARFGPYLEAGGCQNRDDRCIAARVGERPAWDCGQVEAIDQPVPRL